MRRRPFWAILTVLLSLGWADCTEVTDLWAINGPPKDTNPGPDWPFVQPDVPGDSQGDAGPDIVDEACIPDPCAQYHRTCVNGYCGDCIPGWVENTSGLCEQNSDPCDPDPCFGENRECIAGSCGGCLPGYTENADGHCVGSGDPCDPNPCADVNKQCVNGFCAGCLPGYVDDGAGNCLPPNPCNPNPCSEPLKTVCLLDENQLPYCVCDLGTHDDGFGGCTFDPCIPNPCDPPLDTCTSDGPAVDCGCPFGQLKQIAPPACVDDPCEPNPCTSFGKGVCEVDADAVGWSCGCDTGFVPAPDGVNCQEGPATVGVPPEPSATVVIDNDHQLFVDDWLVKDKGQYVRRVHQSQLADATFSIGPDPELGGIGRARANGSLVYVPAEVRAQLPPGDPLANYPWRIYYMGYRQLWMPDTQPSWLCVAAAQNAAGPWVKPQLDFASPAPHCVLRDDGMAVAEVSLLPADSPVGPWVLSVSRLPMGSVPAPGGVHLYTSPDGVSWTPLGNGPYLGLAIDPVPPAYYARIGERSRIVWDDFEGRFTAFTALVSVSAGDARGVMFGYPDPAAGWALTPDALAAPWIVGPNATETATGREYKAMAAWRVGGLWLGVVQKAPKTCPKTAWASLFSSRDGRAWTPVLDELIPNLDAFFPFAPVPGGPDAHVDTLLGGGPAEGDGLWHFYVGGTVLEPCMDATATGGLYRATTRVAGVAGLELAAGIQAKLPTRGLTMAPGHVGSELHVNALVNDKLLIQLERVSPTDAVLGSAEALLTAGDHVDVPLDLGPITHLTKDRFRITFTLTSGGEIFGFRLADPYCTPNPCADEPVKTSCETDGSEAVCVCPPELHDDGAGGCTDDPCIPDPCTGPHHTTCTPLEGGFQCGCEDGWVAVSSVFCVEDPCLPDELGNPPCVAPGPDRCHVVDGLPECYCPEGSEEGPSGCYETDARAFVTSISVQPQSIGGVVGADAICTNLAFAAGLPGAYAAWISTAAEAAGPRFAGGGPWRTWDPDVQLWTRLVAASYGDLVDGSIEHPIAATEFGGQASASCAAWTGSTPTGVAPPPIGVGFGGDCQGWTANLPGGQALAGDCHASDAGWTASGTRECTEALSLYCLELPIPAGP